MIDFYDDLAENGFAYVVELIPPVRPSPGIAYRQRLIESANVFRRLSELIAPILASNPCTVEAYHNGSVIVHGDFIFCCDLHIATKIKIIYGAIGDSLIYDASMSVRR